MKTNRVVIESIILGILSVIIGVFLSTNKIYFFLPANYLPGVVDAVEKGSGIEVFFIGIITSLIAALIEESVFRLLPYKIWYKLFKWIPYWFMGFFTSFIFALIHTNYRNGFEFPLLQFFSGLYFWSLIRYKNGYGLAITSHIIFNLTIFTIMATLTFLQG